MSDTCCNKLSVTEEGGRHIAFANLMLHHRKLYGNGFAWKENVCMCDGLCVCVCMTVHLHTASSCMKMP